MTGGRKLRAFSWTLAAAAALGLAGHVGLTVDKMQVVADLLVYALGAFVLGNSAEHGADGLRRFAETKSQEA